MMHPSAPVLAIALSLAALIAIGVAERGTSIVRRTLRKIRRARAQRRYARALLAWMDSFDKHRARLPRAPSRLCERANREYELTRSERYP